MSQNTPAQMPPQERQSRSAGQCIFHILHGDVIKRNGSLSELDDVEDRLLLTNIQYRQNDRRQPKVKNKEMGDTY